MRDAIRWFKCKLKPPKHGKRDEEINSHEDRLDNEGKQSSGSMRKIRKRKDQGDTIQAEIHKDDEMVEMEVEGLGTEFCSEIEEDDLETSKKAKKLSKKRNNKVNNKNQNATVVRPSNLEDGELSEEDNDSDDGIVVVKKRKREDFPKENDNIQGVSRCKWLM